MAAPRLEFRKVTRCFNAKGRGGGVFEPGLPSAASGWPSRKTIVGDIAERRALPGAIEFGLPGSGSKLCMPLLYMKPRPGVTTPEPSARVCVMATTLPWRSATVRWFP